jgi:hypothetical protein
MAGASAADNGTAPVLTVNNSSVQENLDQPVSNQSKAAITVNTIENSSSSYNQSTVTSTVNPVNSSDTVQNNDEAAAGMTETVTTTFTLSQIKDAASRVKSYIQTNKQLPSSVTIGNTQVQMSDFLKLMTSALLEINSGTTTPITLKTVPINHPRALKVAP